MARGINKAIIVGNLGADPEVRQTGGGTVVTNLRIATTEVWKDKQTGDAKEQTEWHAVVLFGKLAEIAGQYLRKGAQVYLEGRIRTRKWQDKNGADRYTTEIVASELQMLGGRTAGAGSVDAGGSARAPAPAAPAAAQQVAPAADLDDEIPF